MSTQTTDLLYQNLRMRLLTYVDPDGNTLAQANALGAPTPNYDACRLYRIGAPDNVVLPYAVLTIKSPMLRPESDALVLMADVEVMCFGRGRSTQPAIEAIADRAMQALLTYRDTADGLLWFTSATVASLPMFTAPADSDVVQVRVLAKLQCYPSLIHRLTS